MGRACRHSDGARDPGHAQRRTAVNDPNSKQAKEITGKSPMRIAIGRLRKDKIAVVCAVIVIFFFVLIAVFAGR